MYSNLDDSSFQHIFKKQITKLELINKDCERMVGSLKIYSKNVYAHILTYFENLKHFTVIEAALSSYPGLSILYLPSNTFSSSKLTYLRINVHTLTDCLCLLDGRLKQLNTFIVGIHSMDMDDTSMIQNMVSIFYRFEYF